MGFLLLLIFENCYANQQRNEMVAKRATKKNRTEFSFPLVELNLHALFYDISHKYIGCHVQFERKRKLLRSKFICVHKKLQCVYVSVYACACELKMCAASIFHAILRACFDPNQQRKNLTFSQ